MSRWLDFSAIRQHDKKVQVGNDQEMGQSETHTPKTEGWKKTKVTHWYLNQENIS